MNQRMNEDYNVNADRIHQTHYPVPQEEAVRNQIWESVKDHVKRHNLIPPISLEGLRKHADALIQTKSNYRQYRDYVTVLMGNGVWMDIVASIPPDRRILLLPQCMRDRSNCPAEMDEFGLLCMECGGCATGELQSFAEDLGTVVLVAEGTTVVTKLLEQGQIDAVIGVSCLSALERSFPYMAAAAIPGIAIPLIQEGCDQTQIDMTTVKSFLSLKGQTKWAGRTDLDDLKTKVQSWFTEEAMSELLDRNNSATEKTSVEWMAAGGKRWRPFLAAAVYQTLRGCDTEQLETIHKIAVSVECFHKASLVHDDIEDDDDLRYGQPTLQNTVGMPVALNVGDLLVGEGYRLIAEFDAPSDIKARMLTAASNGHRDLCVGQGAELFWQRDKGPISVHEVLEIFQRKTAPAFVVALTLGAIFGGGDESLCFILKKFSEALGVAYQIRDDIDDFKTESSDNDMVRLRPSLLLALALENANGHSDDMINALRETDGTRCISLIHRHTNTQALVDTAQQMLEHYQNCALEALEQLDHVPLKSLLYRVVYKIFGRPDIPIHQHNKSVTTPDSVKA